MDNDIDRKIDVTPIQALLVQNRHKTHAWNLIWSSTTGLGIQVWFTIYGARIMYAGTSQSFSHTFRKLEILGCECAVKCYIFFKFAQFKHFQRFSYAKSKTVVSQNIHILGF